MFTEALRAGPGTVQALRTMLRPANWTERRQALAHRDIPATLQRAPRVPGSMWGVTMMHNEEDVAEHVVRHMLEQGASGVIVADNLSDDRTPDILAALAAEAPVHVVRDRWTAHAQGTKMTLLAKLAARSGADWVVPFDADELWFAPSGTVSQMLRSSKLDIVSAEIHNVFPGLDDDPSEPNPFRRLGQFDSTPSEIKKVAFRPHRFFKVWEGNLGVTMAGRKGSGLFIAHYPFRSFEQMAAKLRHGRQSLGETRFSSDIGYHWRVAGGWSDDMLADAYRQLQEGVPVLELAWSPIGPMRRERPASWRTWNPTSSVAT
jgi:hypothetical protein